MEHFPWWNEAQRELAEEARQFTDEVLRPLGEECAWKKEFPQAVIDQIAKRGWFGALIPARYGGHREEWGVTGTCIIVEEMGRIGPFDTAYVTTMSGGVCQLIHSGNEEQKQRWLPRAAKGEQLGAVGMTEPYAGSDVGGIETTGVRDGDVYIVNGKKRFQAIGMSAGICLTYVKTSNAQEDKHRFRHLTALVIEKGTPGFTIEKVNELIGWDGIDVCYLNFDNVAVPVANRLGEEGDGWTIMNRGLNIERLLASAMPLGQMREALRYAVQHLQRRVQFGQPTMNITTNQFKVADMICRLFLSRLIIYYTAYLIDLGKDTPVESSIAKLFNAESWLQTAIEAIQCMGGNGVTKFYPVERIMRDAKIQQIGAGTSEIMKLLIFRQGLRNMASDLKVPVRAIHDELGVPMPLGKAPPLKTDSSEQDVLGLLAENYRVNPGLHMTMDDIKEQLDISDEDLSQYLLSLEGKGLADLFRDRRGAITLAKASYDGLARANPLEHYRYIPSWVNEKNLF